MSENTLDKKNFISQINIFINKNLRKIIYFLSFCFLLFLFFQVYNFYLSNKIEKDSVVFFSLESNKEIDNINDTITSLSKTNNFYGILSKLELIKINLNNQKIEDAIILYNELFDNSNLNNIYKSAIASKAAYEFIDLNFENLNNNYSETIEKFISIIDDELTNYKSIKLELNYLFKILISKLNNIEYLDYTEAQNLYESIMSSDVAGSATKKRIKKIHEFFFYQ